MFYIKWAIRPGEPVQGPQRQSKVADEDFGGHGRVGLFVYCEIIQKNVFQARRAGKAIRRNVHAPEVEGFDFR